MDNKFINLKKDYRDFLNKISIMIKKIDINSNIDEKLTEEKCENILKLYLEIYKLIEDSTTININDINHIILNCNKTDNNINLLKKFIKIKNHFIITKIIKSKLWQPFITKLGVILSADLNLNKKNKDYLISKGVYRLLNLSINQFRGSWEIVEIDGIKIKKIEIIEPEHFKYLIKYLKEKIN